FPCYNRSSSCNYIFWNQGIQKPRLPDAGETPLRTSLREQSSTGNRQTRAAIPIFQMELSEERCLSAQRKIIVTLRWASFLATRMRMKTARIGHRLWSVLLRKAGAVAFLICMAICGVAGASGTSDFRTGVIILSVIDEKNLPVPSATVEVRASGKLVNTFSTSATGKVALMINAPGTYSLTIQKKGYLRTETALEVSEGNAVQDVDVVLSAAPLSQQTVEVKGEASNPITETSSGPTTLAPTKAKDTPLRPATLVDALPLIPGIVRGPDGSVRIAGFGEDHSALLVNSVDVTDPATGAFGLSVPIDSVQTIEVSE